MPDNTQNLHKRIGLTHTLRMNNGPGMNQGRAKGCVSCFRHDLKTKNDSASKVRGLRAGADDYLTKPFDMDELIARIVSLIRRYTRFNQQDGISQQLEFDGLKIDIENRSVTTKNGTFELPPKEFDLLLYCAKNQGKILTKQQIYEEVWREEYFYDDSNIMAIISRLRKKLEVNPGSPKYIQTIKGIGYRFNKEV